jgi:hypothetical protein
MKLGIIVPPEYEKNKNFSCEKLFVVARFEILI